jgi:hypothetical protein
MKMQLFKLTRTALECYKVSDPLAHARNPRRSYVAFQWDVNQGIAKWFLNIIIILLSFIVDIIILPFQAIRIITKDKMMVD